MKNKIKYLFFSLFILFTFFFTFVPLLHEEKLPSQNDPYLIEKVKIGKNVLSVELADSPSERGKGLSGRDYIGEAQGMLFVFENSSRHGFWMKDMNFAIDILWISDELSIVHVEKGVSPSSYPKIFLPNREARYVLELPAGFSDQNNVKQGDMVEFLP